MNPKQRRFIEEFPLDLNATKAAIRAGYSAKTARQQGSRLLSNADISDAIRESLKDRSERTEITQERVIEILEREAENPENTGSARVAAAAWLGKHLGMFVETHRHKLEKGAGKMNIYIVPAEKPEGR